MVPDDLLAFAQHLADLARAETLKHADGSAPVENKADGGPFDPVTVADRSAEAAIRAAISELYPDHAISGEELGHRPGKSRYCWSLDPIDGTRSYTCGLPTWTTLIALLEEGEPVLGIIDAPALDERHVACNGSAWAIAGGKRRPLQVSNCARLSEARLSTTDPYLFGGASAEAFERLQAGARTTRYGHDGYAYARLAAGGIDLVVECGLKPHDFQALVPVIRSAGGTVGNWQGGGDLGDGDIIAAATPALYEAAVEIMRGSSRPGGGPEES